MYILIKIITLNWQAKYEFSALGKNCQDIKNKGFNQGDGEYFIDPDGGSDNNAFQVYFNL